MTWDRLTGLAIIGIDHIIERNIPYEVINVSAARKVKNRLWRNTTSRTLIPFIFLLHNSLSRYIKMVNFCIYTDICINIRFFWLNKNTF